MSRWNQFDLTILLISYVEVVVDFSIQSSTGSGSLVRTVKWV